MGSSMTCGKSENDQVVALKMSKNQGEGHEDGISILNFAESQLGLADEDKKAVIASMAVLRRDLKGHGVHFFCSLFRTYPDYLSLFQALAALDDETLGRSSALHAHARLFMVTMDSIVESMDNPLDLDTVIRTIVDKHKPFGLTEQDFKKTLGVFLRILQTVEGFDDLKYTRKQIIAGWQKLLAAVVRLVGQRLPSSGDSSDEDEDEQT